MPEICGDIPLSGRDKLRYLTRNLARNLGLGRAGLRVRHFTQPRTARTHPAASPSRVLTEAFLADRLPELLPPRELRILEIGCGSGRLVTMLADVGYRGSYVGVDVEDRFDHRSVTGLSKTFVKIDAHAFESGERYDLIVSVSALEHIPDDQHLIRRLPALLAPQGIQLHFVPSGWGLLTYLWHGYRQFTLQAIARRFDSRDTTVYAMGGLCGFILHVTLITLPELGIGIGIRSRFPSIYSHLLSGALRLDRFLPFCPTMFAIVCRASGAKTAAASSESRTGSSH